MTPVRLCTSTAHSLRRHHLGCGDAEFLSAPHLRDRIPIREKLQNRRPPAATSRPASDEMVEEYQREVRSRSAHSGEQYLTYLGDVARLRLRLLDRQLPGHRRQHDARRATLDHRSPFDDNDPGLRHRHAPRRAPGLAPGAGLHPVPVSTLADVFRHPFFLAGSRAALLFAFRLHWLPALRWLHPRATFPGIQRWASPGMCFKHSLLPALSILLASMGFWALGMRGMMVTVEGEDYMTFAEAAGLKNRTLFFSLRHCETPCCRKRQRSGLSLATNPLRRASGRGDLLVSRYRLGAL